MILTRELARQVTSVTLERIPEEVYRHAQSHIIDGLSIVIRCETILDNLLIRVSPLNGLTNWLRVEKSNPIPLPPSAESLGTEEFIQIFRAISS